MGWGRVVRWRCVWFGRGFSQGLALGDWARRVRDRRQEKKERTGNHRLMTATGDLGWVVCPVALFVISSAPRFGVVFVSHYSYDLTFKY